MLMISAATPDDADALVATYEWLFAPPGSRPPQWDPERAAERLRRGRGATHLELDSAHTRADAHRFYEREQPSWSSISFGWEL